MSRLINFGLTTALTIAMALNPALASACTEADPPRFDGSPEGGVSVSVGRIAGMSWIPMVIDGKPVPDEAGLWLSVSMQGEVEGNTGCNRFTGQADMDAGTLILGPLAVTEMTCAEPAATEREAAFLKALGEVRGFVVSPARVWLTREDGSVAVCLRP